VANEARDVWLLYLERALAGNSGKFEDAFRHARPGQQRAAVLGKQAAFHFERGDFSRAARVYAKVGAELEHGPVPGTTLASSSSPGGGSDGDEGGYEGSSSSGGKDGSEGAGAASVLADLATCLTFEAVSLKFLEARQETALEVFLEEKVRG